MTRICHMTSAHTQEDVRIFQKECVSLAQAGYEVYFVSPGDTYEKNGVHIVGIEKGNGRLDRILHTTKRVYEAALALDAAVYHIHDPELLPSGMKLKRKGKKVIFDSHEIYTQQFRYKPYLPRWCSYLLAYAYGIYERYVFRRIDGLVYPPQLEQSNPYKGLCQHVAVVDNVPRLEELYDRYDPSVEKYPDSVCYVGSLAHMRGITHLVKAAPKAGCTVYLGGKFIPPEYQAQIQALPEFSHVSYLGMLSRDQVFDTISHCRVGMATLLKTGQYVLMGNLVTKAYEYMSLGVPVILSDTPLNKALVKKYQFGVCVDPEDIDATASAIRRLLDDPDTARQMGENGRRAVKEIYNWDIEKQHLLKLYDELLVQ